MYIVSICGSSGCGKSRLLRDLGAILAPAFGTTLRVYDERLFHHPQLIRMFDNAAQWALPIQLNFLIQRSMALMNAFLVDPGALVLVERSIDEDALFASYYASLGLTNGDEQTAYDVVHRKMSSRTPSTSLRIYLEGDVETQANRIEEDIRTGRREMELTGERLRQYLSSINSIYAEWAGRMRLKNTSEAHWVDWGVNSEIQVLASQIAAAFRERDAS